MKKVTFLLLFAIIVIGGASAGWYFEDDIRDVFEDDDDDDTNKAPMAVITMTPSNGKVSTGESFNITAAQSSDPEGVNLTYEWDLDDGTVSTALNLSHSYSAVGTYNITLTVSDGERTGTTVKEVTVSPTDYHAEEQGTVSGTGDSDDVVFPVDEGANEVEISFTLTDSGSGFPPPGDPPASVTLRLTDSNGTVLREETGVDEDGDDTWTFTSDDLDYFGDYTFTIESENNGSMDWDVTIDVTY